MIAEFEHVYRLLDLPDTVQAGVVRDVFARRQAALEQQQQTAGSKPERLIARKHLRELTERQPDLERLAAALEVGEFLAEARTAISERRGARAKRALGYARASAGKAGLDALQRGVAEVEDEFADSGLARDEAFDAELDELEAQAEAWLKEIEDGSKAGTPPPLTGAVTLAGLQARAASLGSRAGSRTEPGAREAIATLKTRLQAGAELLPRWQSDHALREKLARATATREQIEKAFPAEARERAKPDDLAGTATDIGGMLADAFWNAGAFDAALASRIVAEREALAALRRVFEKARERRVVVIALERLEADTTGDRWDEALVRRLADLKIALAAPDCADLVPRCETLEAGLERAEARRKVESMVVALEAAARAGNFNESFPAHVSEAEAAAKGAQFAEFEPRLAALRAAFALAQRRVELDGALHAIERQAADPALDVAAVGAALVAFVEEAKAATLEAAFAARVAAVGARLADLEEKKKRASAPAPVAPPAKETKPASAPVATPSRPVPEPARADRFTLLGPEGERCHVICADRILFGRSQTCDVVLRAYHPADRDEEHRVSTAISRRQFAVQKESDDALLLDGGPTPEGGWQRSSNGTFELTGKDIERVRLFRSGLASFAIVRNAPPVAPPQWDVQLQMRATLPPSLAPLRDALPAGPDALYLRRTDGVCEDVLIIWRAADLQAFGLTDSPAQLVRSLPGFLLGQDDKMIGLETGFRVGTTWTVASLGTLTFRK